MKKISLLLILIFIFLTACGTNKTLEKSEVLTQASEAAETINSYAMDMVLTINAMDMETKIEGSADITNNPDTMYMTMIMGLLGMSMEIETYVNENEAFIKMFGEWFMMDTEELGLDGFDQLNKQEMDKLVRISEDFEMTEENGMYVLTLSGTGDQYTEIVEPYIQSSMGNFFNDPKMAEEVRNISVNSLDLVLHIDKKTMIMMTQSIQADLEVDGEPMQIDGNMNVSKLNEIEPIVVPDVVREKAIENFLIDEEPMSFEEIQENVDFKIPEITALPEGFTLIDSWYDDSTGMVMLNYEKNGENGFSLSIYPVEEVDTELFEDEEAETVLINGNEASLSDMDGFIFMTWIQDGLFLELAGGASEITRDTFIELAESVQ